MAYAPGGDIITVEVSGNWRRLGTYGATLRTPDGWLAGIYHFAGGAVEPSTHQMVMRGHFRPS